MKGNSLNELYINNTLSLKAVKGVVTDTIFHFFSTQTLYIRTLSLKSYVFISYFRVKRSYKSCSIFNHFLCNNRKNLYIRNVTVNIKEEILIIYSISDCTSIKNDSE